MKFYLLIVSLYFLFIIGLSGQDNTCAKEPIPGYSINEVGREIPEIKIRKSKGSLPPFHDNSLSPFFPPFRCMGYYSCHGFSSIYFALSYELNRMRGTPAELPENTLSELFAYNFLNSGSAVIGANYYDILDIVRAAGNPFWKDFSLDSTTIIMNEKLWMTGYDKYLESFKNRISGYYAIKVNSEEGIENLKQWLYHHNEDSPYGGVANCIIGGPNVMDTIQLPTSYNGLIYLKSSGPYFSHSVTITGYDDSVTFDFNGDGISTTEIDINGDDLVNLYDCELGAFIISETFGSSDGNNGRHYYPYRFFSTVNPNRLWHDEANIIVADTNAFPLVTARIKLNHTCRNKIKVFTGVSKDTASISPENIYEYPHFYFQGGNFPMQGLSADSSKTIEFALDLTPLLSYINSGELARFFVCVKENDFADTSEGYLVEFEVNNHITGEVHLSPQNHLELKNDSITSLSVVCQINFNKPEITDSVITLEPDISGYPVSSDGGTPGFHWQLINEYTYSQSSLIFPETLENNFIPWDSSNYFTQLDLDFDFPFYGTDYNSIYISVEGMVFFDSPPFLWPYFTPGENTIKTLKLIAPFFTNMKIRPGGGISYTKNDTLAIISWKLTNQNTDTPGTEVDFCVKLHSSGKIDFCYGNLYFADNNWIAGVSDGSGSQYTILEQSGETNFCSEKSFSFNYIKHPDHFQIDDTGWLSFVRNLISSGDSIYLKITDSIGLFDKKHLSFKFPEGIFTDDYDPQVFPNPFSDFLYIPVYQKNNDQISICLYDAFGRKLAEINNIHVENGYHVLRFDEQYNLSSGVYFLNLTVNGKMTVKKIVKL